VTEGLFFVQCAIAYTFVYSHKIKNKKIRKKIDRISQRVYNRGEIKKIVRLEEL